MALLRAGKSVLFALCAGPIALYVTPAAAEPPTYAIEEMSDKAEATHDREADPKKTSLLVVPIPQSRSPTHCVATKS